METIIKNTYFLTSKLNTTYFETSDKNTATIRKKGTADKYFLQ